MKSLRSLVPVCGLILAALILNAGAALACTEQCVTTSQTPLCKRCQDVGYYTGATCVNVGTCGCFYTPNACEPVASGIQAQTALATVAAPAGKGAVCAAPPAEAILPDVLLQ